jgi:hypothetical protein
MSLHIDASSPLDEQTRRAIALDLAVDLAKNVNEFANELVESEDILSDAAVFEHFIKFGATNEDEIKNA